MRIYLMTDLEAVAGVLDFENWCTPQSQYNDLAKELLTAEVNAAIDGFFSAGATEILVADGHGSGGINPALLDPRVELQRGWGPGPYPLGMEGNFDACAWVGQHAKSRTELSHLTHTQSFGVLEISVNRVAIGEFGQVALCASQLGIPAIFA
ncbi:MAG: M55 family metallopeptidase, partial [Planctomycetota bacterium]|nr:M55 family metallopeptidase [Planctomycetota bacterium]